MIKNNQHEIGIMLQMTENDSTFKENESEEVTNVRNSMEVEPK